MGATGGTSVHRESSVTKEKVADWVVFPFESLAITYQDQVPFSMAMVEGAVDGPE